MLRPVIAVGVAAVVLVAMTTIALGQEDQPPPVREVSGAETASPSARPVVEAVQPGHQALGVLRRQRTADDALSADLEKVLQREALMGENAKEARAALKTALRSYYVLPARNDVVCAYTDTGSGGCGSVESVMRGEFGGTEICAPGDSSKYIQWGMVPDGAKRLTATFADGREASVGVKDNVYAFAVERSAPPPMKYAWEDRGQRVEVPVIVDELVLQARCG
jgi:hypothetical protein